MYYIGIDLGGTKIAVGLVDEKGRIIYKQNIPTRRERPYTDIIRDMMTLSTTVAQEANISLNDIKSIGIGTPGVPDIDKKAILYSCNLNFNNVPMKDEVRKYIDLPVKIENDANCAALAESIAGAAKGTDSSITVTLGTGIGVGIVINRKLYSGFNNAGGEPGHMVINIDGEQCTCGRRGCWETYASATALKRQTQKAIIENRDSLMNIMVNNDINQVSGKTAFEAARKGDSTGQKVVQEYIGYLGEGLTNIINILAPQIVVIGGGVSKEGEYLLQPLREIVAERVYCKACEQTKIVCAEMGNDAGIIGAAMLGKVD